MRAYRLSSAPSGDGRLLELGEEERQRPGPGEVVVRIAAASLNYRDLMVLSGGYARNNRDGVIPLSDGAGTVTEIGSGVGDWSEGDRVVINFMRDWADGQIDETALASGLGGGIDGVLAEEVVIPASTLVKIPDAMSFAEAATLPCAAVTAWHGLRRCGVTAGSTLLTLGTGGVSIFALQLGKAMGAEVVITSSSDDKLERAKALGADHTINYRKEVDWASGVRERLGRGVDAIIETGGAGTLEQSFAAAGPGGHLALIGVLTEGLPDIKPVLLNALTVHGIYVGSTAMLADVVAAMRAANITPVIDKRFPFEEAQAAYDHLKSGNHLGKIVIEMDAA